MKLAKLLDRVARSPFFRGMGRALDLTGALNERVGPDPNMDPWEADNRALYGDWEALGRDFVQVTARDPHLTFAHDRLARPTEADRIRRSVYGNGDGGA